MPTYEYNCDDCGDFDYFQRITEDALEKCPHCGGTSLRRLVSLSSFQLKGSGWYKTDYSSNGGKSKSLESKVKKDSSSKCCENKAMPTKSSNTCSNGACCSKNP